MELVAALLLPVVLVVLGHRLSRRLKELDDSQWRNQELVKARLDYYKVLAPPLNDLVCFFTFIGGWKELTPPRVIEIKRQLDRDFHVALPLFSTEANEAYRRFMKQCFLSFGNWGEDAKLRTSSQRRRQALGTSWNHEWDPQFDESFSQGHTVADLSAIRDAYDRVLASMVRDIKLLEARERYATDEISINA
ncbi:hypothetical protein SAMN05660662_0975 [Blastococcus aurantiacus]|uniref:Uncharacterized protein n=1 Tax=Blastococcus aurantiacus TaxID=1550231 RepID=A0A1G7I402_9ACTN|nr:hypothetical protein SAMN05660662_0975 [Blastococcus aurantiacus]